MRSLRFQRLQRTHFYDDVFFFVLLLLLFSVILFYLPTGFERDINEKEKSFFILCIYFGRKRLAWPQVTDTLASSTKSLYQYVIRNDSAESNLSSR